MHPGLDLLKFLLISILCVCVRACLSVRIPNVYRHTWVPEGGTRFFGPRVIGYCELLDVGEGNRIWVLSQNSPKGSEPLCHLSGSEIRSFKQP